MNLPELITDKSAIFAYPKTQKEILGNKKRIYIDHYNGILPALSARKIGEAIIFSPDLEFIPGENDPFPKFSSDVNAQKRGQYARLETLTQKERRIRRWTDAHARIESCERYAKQPNSNLIGLTWRDDNANNHYLLPTEIIEAQMMIVMSRASQSIANRITIGKDRSAHDTPLAKIEVSVPSVSGNEKARYDFLLINTAKDPRSIVNIEQWPNMITDHMCKHKRYAQLTFAAKNVVFHCAHEIAAWRAYSEKVARKLASKDRRASVIHKDIIPQLAPMVTEPLVRTFFGLRYNTMRERYENGRIYLRPPSTTAINRVLMESWRTYGNRSTFYVKETDKPMRYYNWDINAPGLPFKK